MKRLIVVLMLVFTTGVLWGDRLYLGKAGNRHGVTKSTQDMFVGKMIDTFTAWDVSGIPGCAYGVYVYLVINKQAPFLIPVARVILRMTYRLAPRGDY